MRIPLLPLAVSLLLVGAVAAPAAGQLPPQRGWLAQSWTTANGLPQNSVNDILVRRSGELWLATAGGLVRFDGLSFRTFDLATLPGLPSTRIMALADDDAADGLWAATQDGDVVRVVDGRITRTLPRAGWRQPALALVAVTGDRLWLTTAGGDVWLFDGRTWRALALGALDTNGAVDTSLRPANLAAGADGTVWVGRGREVLHLAPDGGVLGRLRLSGSVGAIALTTDGRLVVGVGHDLLITDTSLQAPSAVPLPVPGPVTAIAAGDESLDVSTAAGAARLVYADGAWRPATTIAWSHDASPALHVLRRDRCGNTWAGFQAHGLTRLRMQPVTRYLVNDVKAVVGDAHGGLTAAAGCRSLFTQQGETLVALPDADRPCTTALHRDAAGLVWIGTGNGLFTLGPSGWSAVASVRGAPVWAVTGGPDASVWTAQADGTINRLRDGRPIETFSLPPEHRPLTLAVALDATVWIGSERAVFAWRSGRLTTWTTAHGLPSGPVRAVWPNADGTAWTGTYGGGLALVRGSRVAPVRGLPDNGISGIVEDRLRRLWVLTNRGLIVADAAQLVAAIDGRAAGPDVVLLGIEAGVPEGNHGSPSAWRAPDGNQLYFSTIEGVVAVRADLFPSRRSEPGVSITGVAADGVPLAAGDIVEVPAASFRVDVSFTSWALTAPERVMFKWRLDGADAAWSAPADARGIGYTRLAPGDYLFRVLARNESGVWGTREATVLLRVLPAWYQAWWVRGLAGIAAIGLLVAFHRSRTARVREQTRLLTSEMAHRTEAQEQAARLRAQLEHASRVTAAGELATSLAHEVNQPLAAIASNAQAARRYLEQAEPPIPLITEILDDVVRQSQRASDVIQSLRVFLRKSPPVRSRHSLSDIVTGILPLVRAELEAHHVALRLDLAGALPPVLVDRVQVQQVLVNLVTNAREALERVETGRLVILRTRASAGRVRLECHDSGPGLPAALAEQVFEPFVTSKAHGMGMGLAICRALVEANGGHLWYEGLDRGTVFIAEFPTTPAERA